MNGVTKQLVNVSEHLGSSLLSSKAKAAIFSRVAALFSKVFPTLLYIHL